MRRECREGFPHHRLKRKPLVSDPVMHHGTCVTHVPWCMSGSQTRGGGENVPGIPGACATRNFTHLVRGPYIFTEHLSWPFRLSALLQLHLHLRLNIWLQWIAQRQLRDETRNIYVLEFRATYFKDLTIVCIVLIVICEPVMSWVLQVWYTLGSLGWYMHTNILPEYLGILPRLGNWAYCLETVVRCMLTFTLHFMQYAANCYGSRRNDHVRADWYIESKN